MNNVQNELDKIANAMTDKKLVSKAGAMASEIIRDHIYHGNKLAPLSAATTAYRGEGKPLQDTGALRDSINYEVQSSNTVSVGTTSRYAPVHNNGAEINARAGHWLCIPATGTRQLERRYGKKPSEVIDGLKSEGFSVFFKGRTICYRKKGKRANSYLAYYLKKSVKIPKREFFYLTKKEIKQITEELSDEYFSGNGTFR